MVSIAINGSNYITSIYAEFIILDSYQCLDDYEEIQEKHRYGSSMDDYYDILRRRTVPVKLKHGQYIECQLIT